MLDLGPHMKFCRVFLLIQMVTKYDMIRAMVFRVFLAR